MEFVAGVRIKRLAFSVDFTVRKADTILSGIFHPTGLHTLMRLISGILLMIYYRDSDIARVIAVILVQAYKHQSSSAVQDEG